MNWKYFSLEQINQKNGPDWKVWEQDGSYLSRSLAAFRAIEASRRQGEDAFERFHVGVLKARFEDRKNIADKEVLKQVAVASGLDIARWERDIADPAILESLAKDHTATTRTYNTFGVPTIFAGNGRGFYLRLEKIPQGEEAVETFETMYKLMTKHPYMLEIKQPSYPAKD